MPEVDVAATRAAAGELSRSAQGVAGLRPDTAVATLSQQVPDSTTRSVLGDLQSALQLRLLDLSTEIGVLSTGMSTLADNVEQAMEGP